MDSGALTNPVSDTAGTTLGQTATYTSTPGYNVVGRNTRICQDTGVLSGSVPTCKRTLLPTCMCSCAFRSA